MKNILLFLLLTGCFIVSCRKEEEPLPNFSQVFPENHQGSAMRNGELWSGRAYWRYLGQDTQIDSTKCFIGINTFDSEGTSREQLSFLFIPLKVGKYVLKNPDFSYSLSAQSIAGYTSGHDDEIDGSWYSNNDKDNFIEILSIDTATKIMKCKFDVRLKIYDNSTNLNYPSKVHFTEGQIECTILQ
jgi:hypothetical protein